MAVQRAGETATNVGQLLGGRHDRVEKGAKDDLGPPHLERLACLDLLRDPTTHSSGLRYARRSTT